MDLYSFVFSQSVWGFLFTGISVMAYTLIMGLLTKSFFNKKWIMIIFILLYIVIRLVIYTHINKHIQQVFLKSDIHSVVILKENYANGEGYRFKLKNGISFLNSDYNYKIEIGDSIVKGIKEDSINVFRQDTSINDYVFLKRIKYYH